MEKSVRKILTVFAFTMAASALIGGIGLCKANLSAEATSSESSDFKVKGASVRVVDGEYQPAVRFHVEMSKTEYESYGIADSGVTTGTLILPESKLQQGETLNLNSADVLNIVTKNEENNFWHSISEGKMESVAYVSEIPETDYSTELSVVGYVTTANGETFYTQQVNDISLAWVAYAEYKDENSVLSQQQRESLMETYATFDVSFNGKTQRVRYGEKLTAPEVGDEDGKTVIGWYNRNYTNQWSFSDNVVKGNVNLFAKYSVTPVVSCGVLTWSGSADKYNIYNGETLLGKEVSGNSYDLAKALNYTQGNYNIRIEPVDNKSIEYKSVKFDIVGLTQDNFTTELSNSSADKYYILTQNISVKYKSSDYAWGSGYTPVKAVGGKISYIPSFEGVLDGNGYGINIQYKGNSQYVGGLFGTMQNAVIRNLVYTAVLNPWGNATESGGLVREIGANSIVENCYISVRLKAAQGDGIENTFGAITHVASSATSTVRNCVVDAVMYDPNNSNARVWLSRAINGTAGNNMNVYNNAFILNFDALPEIDSNNKDDKGNSYAELYAAGDLTSANNYVYATLDDFVNGKNCNRWTYKDKVSSWENNVVSAGKVYEGWQNTSFAYDATNGLTLCGKPIQTTV